MVYSELLLIKCKSVRLKRVYICGSIENELAADVF